jgi:predicted MarR family transcription regulator
VKNAHRCLAQLLIPINLNKLKQENELHIYDAYSHRAGAECLCEYVAMTRLIVIPAPLWRVNMSTRFKTLNDINLYLVRNDTDVERTSVSGF